jgi:RNA polymerase sigma-70 factor (ECF subfamily)
MLRQSIRLAFIAALQNLAPKQRAVLLLMECWDARLQRFAEILETSVASVNSALQRGARRIAQSNQEEAEDLSDAQQIC